MFGDGVDRNEGSRQNAARATTFRERKGRERGERSLIQKPAPQNAVASGKHGSEC